MRIGFLGSIKPYKGLDDLYEALSICFTLNDVDPSDLEILIAGCGSLDRRKWSNLPCNTIIKNKFISDEEFHDDLANLDLIVIPYRQATQSGVAAMAISYGIPILATDCGALNQFVKNGVNGIIVQPAKPLELADKLSTIVNQKDIYSSLLQGGRDRTCIAE